MTLKVTLIGRKMMLLGVGGDVEGAEGDVAYAPELSWIGEFDRIGSKKGDVQGDGGPENAANVERIVRWVARRSHQGTPS